MMVLMNFLVASLVRAWHSLRGPKVVVEPLESWWPAGLTSKPLVVIDAGVDVIDDYHDIAFPTTIYDVN